MAVQLDAADRAALRELQNGALSAVAPRPRGVSACPHCREGFGSASLAIHVRRCRAQHTQQEAVDAAVDTGSSTQRPKRPVRALVDLCVRHQWWEREREIAAHWTSSSACVWQVPLCDRPALPERVHGPHLGARRRRGCVCVHDTRVLSVSAEIEELLNGQRR